MLFDDDTVLINGTREGVKVKEIVQSFYAKYNARSILNQGESFTQASCKARFGFNWSIFNSIFFCAAMYQQLGEKGSEMENLDYQTKKVEDLQKRISTACLSSHHVELVKL